MTTIHDREGNEIQVVTESELKGWLSRYLLSALAAWAVVVFSIIVWAVRLEATVDENTKRIEEVRTEGSLPLRNLRTELDSTRFVVGELLKELQRLREDMRR